MPCPVKKNTFMYVCSRRTVCIAGQTCRRMQMLCHEKMGTTLTGNALDHTQKNTPQAHLNHNLLDKNLAATAPLDMRFFSRQSEPYRVPCTQRRAKVPPKDRIFWRTRGSRHGGGVLTCGSPEPAARPIRPLDENPILWRDFCSEAGRPRHIPRRIRAGGQANRSQTWRVCAQTCRVPRNDDIRQVCARICQDNAPFHEHSAFFERLRAMRARDVPCTRPTRDALRHTPTPHAAPPTHRTSRAANRGGPAAQRSAGPPWQVIIPAL